MQVLKVNLKKKIKTVINYFIAWFSLKIHSIAGGPGEARMQVFMGGMTPKSQTTIYCFFKDRAELKEEEPGLQ